MRMKILAVLSISLLALVSCNQAAKEPQTEKTLETPKNVVVENILSRRSIRVYKPEQVAQAQLDTIIQCGINAPSALNKQSWEVRVIQNPELLAQINAKFVENAKGKSLPGSASKAQQEGFSVFHGAPTLIIVAKDKNNGASEVDCGLFAQNILLSAESMNIGTCVIGSVASVFNKPDAKDLLKAINLPDTHEVIFGISVGYKNESPEAKNRDANKVQYIK
ncbi:Nitroreductase [Dysgonomonas macrotermitis]|uniref:Nitroreductase n=2 Tax=Dysgonomonas macrotermitis TaxID=1346286 RepID=A0A1M5HUR4_9BACT|nr:Nitroreductase [Dysgonomonas macrotermitis]